MAGAAGSVAGAGGSLATRVQHPKRARAFEAADARQTPNGRAAAEAEARAEAGREGAAGGGPSSVSPAASRAEAPTDARADGQAEVVPATAPATVTGAVAAVGEAASSAAVNGASPAAADREQLGPSAPSSTELAEAAPALAFARPTSASERRHAEAPVVRPAPAEGGGGSRRDLGGSSAGRGARASAASAPPAAVARSATEGASRVFEHVAVAREEADALTEPGGEEASAVSEMGEVLTVLLSFLRAASALVERPMPDSLAASEAAAILPPDVQGGADADALAAADARDEIAISVRDGARVVRARAAMVLERQRAYVELAHGLGPMRACLEGCVSALRSRGLMRTHLEETRDGTLGGIVSEVEAMVAAEAERGTAPGSTPRGVAQHVLQRVQAELDVSSIGEITPRIGELTRAARYSVTLIRRLRTSLDLDEDASVEECLGAASRAAKGAEQLGSLVGHLCALLEVGSAEAVVPAVRQLALATGRGARCRA